MHKILYDFINRNKNEVKIHIICWALYIAYEALVTRVLNERWSSFYYYALAYLLNISLFYVHALLILPTTTKKNSLSVWLTGMLIVVEAILYVLGFLVVGFFLEYLQVKKQALTLDLKFFVATLFRGSFFIFYSTGYFYYKRNLERKQQQMNKALELEQVKNHLLAVEKDFLRSQINPHLLFNTLTFIKNASRKTGGEAAADAIQSLSDIMSYALRDTKGNFVAISEELEQVENMIGLNKLRFDDTFALNYQRDIDNDQYPVLPLIFLTLVENLFKHGNFREKNSPASIEISCRAGKLLFKTSNLPTKERAMMSEETGIENIILRLMEAYPGKHNFNYGMRDGMFQTTLEFHQ